VGCAVATTARVKRAVGGGLGISFCPEDLPRCVGTCEVGVLSKVELVTEMCIINYSLQMHVCS